MFPKFSIHQRYVFAIIGFLVTLVGYMMRISLELTLSHMVNQTVTAEPVLYDPYSCLDITAIANLTDIITIGNVKPGPFDWDENTQKSVTSAFRTPYIMTQFVSGMMANRSGGKKILGFSLLVLSISTFIIPFGIKLFGSSALEILRFISGMASGTFIPALMSMMSKWAPADERAFIGSLIFPGSLLGYITGSYLGELMMQTLGWEAVYYLFGLLGLILLAKLLVFSTPNEHPNISENEKRYLNDKLVSLERVAKYDLDALPWKGYLRCGALWGTAVGYIGHEWAFRTFKTQVPQFMKDVLRLDITISSFFLYMPFVCIWLAALLFGFACDIIVKKRICSTNNARKIFTAIGTIGAAFSITMIMYSGLSPVSTLFWMFIGMVVCGAYYSGCIISALDFAPNYAGSAIGVIDNIAIMSVILMPMLNDVIISDALLQQWRLSFWIVVVLLVISLAVYVYYVKADQEWWDDVRSNGYPENWKHGKFPCEGLIDENGESIYKARKDVDKDETKFSEL